MGTDENHETVATEPRWPVCEICGSDRVVADAWASWSREANAWELQSTFDNTFCHACEFETTLEWRSTDVPRSERIRRQNDALRTGRRTNGQVMTTAGVAANGNAFVVACRQAVAAFNAFSADNDPYQEHDFGALNVDGERVFFKLDYFNPTLDGGSEDPADPAITTRVLTIMLASEY